MVTWAVSQAQKNSDEAHPDIAIMMARLSTKNDFAMDNIDGFNDQMRDMEGDLKNLETRMIAGFRNEGTERRKICDGLERKKRRQDSEMRQAKGQTCMMSWRE